MYDQEKASRSIKAARIASGVRQDEMAENLGVSQATLSNWETGKTTPDIAHMVNMSELLGCTVDELVGKK